MSQALPSILVTQHRNNDGTLRGVARYGEPIAALELDGKRGTVEAEALSVRVLETRADGSVLVAYLIERANAFRGRWVAALSPSHAMEESLRLCVGSRWWNTEETWFELDRGLHTPRLERARWLFLAESCKGRPWTQPVTAEDARVLGIALERCGDDWIRVAYGRALNALGQHTEALAVLEGHPLDRARALLGLERYVEVLRAIDEWPMASHESEARAHWLRGKALLGLGRDEEAMISLLAALSSDDLNSYELGARHDDLPAAAFRSVAVEGFRMGRFEDALQGYAGLLLKGQCFEALGRFAEARDQYEQARALQPTESIAALLALEKKAALLAPKASAKSAAFDLGDKVTHAKLGDGDVDVEDGNAPRLLIAFESGAEKWLAASAVRKR
jgi:tetratricopeptide (TPR) repeat protein